MDNNFYDDYDRYVRLVCPGYDQCLELIAGSIPKNTKSLLDLGSGTGNLLLLTLKDHPSMNLYGIELQQNLIDITRNKIKKIEGFKVELIQGDLLKLDWPIVDCITSSLTIHHFDYKQKEEVFKRIYDSCDLFLYFDLFKGKDSAEEEKHKEYLFNFMRSNNFSESLINKAKKEMMEHDKPLTIKEANKLFNSIGFKHEILYSDHGFIIYSCSKKG